MEYGRLVLLRHLLGRGLGLHRFGEALDDLGPHRAGEPANSQLLGELGARQEVLRLVRAQRREKRHGPKTARLVAGSPPAAGPVAPAALEKRRNLHLPEILRAPGNASARERLHLAPAVV